MKKTYILNLALFIAVLIFAMIMSGCIKCFFDIPSLLLIVLSTLFMLTASFSPAEIGKYFKLGFKQDAADRAELEKGIIFFKAMQKYLFIAGCIGFFIGLITMLALLDDPERIGAGMALALITFLYGLFFNMAVAIPFRTGLEKKLKEII